MTYWTKYYYRNQFIAFQRRIQRNEIWFISRVIRDDFPFQRTRIPFRIPFHYSRHHHLVTFHIMYEMHITQSLHVGDPVPLNRCSYLCKMESTNYIFLCYLFAIIQFKTVIPESFPTQFVQKPADFHFTRHNIVCCFTDLHNMQTLSRFFSLEPVNVLLNRHLFPVACYGGYQPAITEIRF